ncbi:MAG: SusF/SusE family outer membrane protein [Bacteroidetes bacterium]|nr:MAG: SusF/SusE family outer membrane protein [Bacteroidota bacterium]
MKRINLFKYAMFFVAAIGLVVFNSCSDDDDDDNGTDPIFVEDGFYIKGEGTALTELDFKGLLKAAPNEADGNNPRTGLFDIHVAVKGGQGFNIVQVAGQEQTMWGPGSDFAEVPMDDRHQDEPKLIFWRGSLVETTDQFIVPEDALYHVAFDAQLGTVAVAEVVWGLIGAATPGGWGSSSQMSATFDLEKMTFVIEDLEMENADWKFRYSNGWKIFFDAPDNTVSVNTNFGTSVNNLELGGPNIVMSDRGLYKYTMTWELGEPYAATEEKTGDLEPAPEYPDAMYVVGDATAYGWVTPGEDENSVMHKLAGGPANDGIYWKILHLEAGEGFKISAENWTEPNLDYGDVDEWDAEGFEVIAIGNDWSVENSGMYMVVLNLQDDEVKVSLREVAVYGIGDAFGGFDTGVEANKFTVDNTEKTVTSPALPADGNIRMYADHPWIPDWWHAEFNVYDGVIEYRGDGGDQPDVPGTAGQVITLMFDDNTATIE